LVAQLSVIALDFVTHIEKNGTLGGCTCERIYYPDISQTF